MRKQPSVHQVNAKHYGYDSFTTDGTCAKTINLQFARSEGDRRAEKHPMRRRFRITQPWMPRYGCVQDYRISTSKPNEWFAAGLQKSERFYFSRQWRNNAQYDASQGFFMCEYSAQPFQKQFFRIKRTLRNPLCISGSAWFEDKNDTTGYIFGDRHGAFSPH
jgi:hypothetical protein